MNRRISTIACAALLAGLAAVTHSEAGEPSGLPTVLPPALETELALSAAPPHLRAGAGVYLFGEEGFELAREATNGFWCFVTRSLGGAGTPNDHIEPMCYEEEGMATYGKVNFDRYRMLRQGLTVDDVEARLAAGFARGEYRSPTRGGVIYMLSPINKVPDGRGGVLDYVPHLMFYAPHVTNQQIGVSTELLRSGDYAFSGLPFLPVSGPLGFIVVPLGREEARQVVAAQRDLVQSMRRFVEVDLRWE